MRVRAETTGERAAEKALVALQQKSRKKQKLKGTYGFECAEGLRGAGTSQRIRGPKLRQESVVSEKMLRRKGRQGIPLKLKSKVTSTSCGMKAADEKDARHE